MQKIGVKLGQLHFAFQVMASSHGSTVTATDLGSLKFDYCWQQEEYLVKML